MDKNLDFLLARLSARFKELKKKIDNYPKQYGINNRIDNHYSHIVYNLILTDPIYHITKNNYAINELINNTIIYYDVIEKYLILLDKYPQYREKEFEPGEKKHYFIDIEGDNGEYAKTYVLESEKRLKKIFG